MTRGSSRKTFHEAARQLDIETTRGGRKSGDGEDDGADKRRSFNDAAHKMPHMQTYVQPTASREKAQAKKFDTEGDVVAHAGKIALALGALGVVYGDIGTSPLYTIQTVFADHHRVVHANAADIYGIGSLIFWALMIEVSVKYAGFIMRAHNRGDGGIMALTALIQRHKVAYGAVLVTLGIFGASLFFGDGMITPAISVLSAVQGLDVAAPALSHLIVPISLAILIALFIVQRFGTHTVGWLFGPVMLLWFAVISILGLREVIHYPGVLQGISPTWGIRFLTSHGGDAFLVLGSVVLCVTGAEALYADRGHFGPGPIRLAWFWIVLPGVMLSYLGQGALILHHPATASNPFYYIVPTWGRIPMVILATFATIIASQAVISGSYSVARQAVTLGFLPRMNVVHTSETEGQIYVPAINWALCIGVAALVLGFRNSNNLANAYGVAVTGTFVLNTVLFLAVARALWQTPRWRLALLGSLFLTVELAFFFANLAKILHGAWFPVAIGVGVSVVMITWRKGRDIVTRNRTEQEGPLSEFLDKLCRGENDVRRVPGIAIFMAPDGDSTPLALRAEVDHGHALQEKVVIVSVEGVGVPYVEDKDRCVVEVLGKGTWKALYVIARFGYQEQQHVPEALALARKQGLLPRNLDLEHASYFLSRITIKPTGAPGMRLWRKKLFCTLARNSASPIEHFGLPTDRTVSIGAQVAL